MIQNIISFTDTKAGDIMTHRDQRGLLSGRTSF